MVKLGIFQKKIYEYYRKEGRVLPWRVRRHPYRILVSEIMLQQTQVDRVIPKYALFLKRFPSFEKLASAPQSEVIRLWQGLGYNRRALHLHQTAKTIVQKYNGRLPKEKEALIALSGIGPYTASALRVFTWNMPEAVIETNIRTVYIHEFFPHKKKVSDAELLPFIVKTIDFEHPRDWYYALMDYGSMLKSTVGNKSRQSVHYVKQSAFKGSIREVRGAILKYLIKYSGGVKLQRILKELPFEKERITGALGSLVKEGLVLKEKNFYKL
jgi:A/G-specific adenine glycosylase